MMENTCVTSDEVIINIVRDHKYIYDKTDSNYKNTTKKKDIWKTISMQLQELYAVDMSAENVEKRWSSLRDMFCREERKKKLPPSGSGYNECKEWHLYQSLLFLSSHIAHRKTQSSLMKKQRDNKAPTKPIQSLEEHNDASIEECREEEALQEMWEAVSIDDTYDASQIIDDDTESHLKTVRRPVSRSSNTSTFSLTSSSTRAPISCKRSKNSMPPMDEFAQRKRKRNDILDEQFAETGIAISNAMNNISTLVGSTANKERDGYMLAIEEGLKHVPGKNRTQCIIAVLQVIQQYEIRE